MPNFDWTAIGDSVREASDDADRALAGEIRQLTGLGDIEIRSLFPTHSEQASARKLLRIVAEATSENERVGKLKESIEEIGPAILRLLSTLR